MLEDEKILALYWARDTAAIQETGVKYGERLLRLSGRMLPARTKPEKPPVRNSPPQIVPSSPSPVPSQTMPKAGPGALLSARHAHRWA